MMHKELAPGTELDFTLTLPAEITRGTEVFVRAHGRVVRMDKRRDEEHETIGVAAVIERYDIIRGEGTACGVCSRCASTTHSVLRAIRQWHDRRNHFPFETSLMTQRCPAPSAVSPRGDSRRIDDSLVNVPTS